MRLKEEIELARNKEELRKEALSKEVLRLRNFSYRQHEKNKRLRLLLIVVSLLLAVSVVYFFSYDTGKTDELLQQQFDQLLRENSLLTQKYEELKNSVSSANNIAEPVSKEPELFYYVQIGAYKNLDFSEFKENLREIGQIQTYGLNRVVLGEFKDYKKAEKFLLELQIIGFEDAYVIAFHDGKVIPIPDARKLERELYK